MRKLSIAILVLGLALMVVLTGCGGGGGGGGGNKGGGTGQTIVTGRVVDDQSPAQPVANVIVTVAGHETRTGTDGRFSINLGTNVKIIGDVFTSLTDAYFYVSTALLDATAYPPFPVKYMNSSYSQIGGLDPAKIPLPLEAASTPAGTTLDLSRGGDIVITYNDPTKPPKPPYQ